MRVLSTALKQSSPFSDNAWWALESLCRINWITSGDQQLQGRQGAAGGRFEGGVWYRICPLAGSTSRSGFRLILTGGIKPLWSLSFAITAPPCTSGRCGGSELNAECRNGLICYSTAPRVEFSYVAKGYCGAVYFRHSRPAF